MTDFGTNWEYKIVSADENEIKGGMDFLIKYDEESDQFVETQPMSTAVLDRRTLEIRTDTTRKRGYIALALNRKYQCILQSSGPQI